MLVLGRVVIDSPTKVQAIGISKTDQAFLQFTHHLPFFTARPKDDEHEHEPPQVTSVISI